MLTFLSLNVHDGRIFLLTHRLLSENIQSVNNLVKINQSVLVGKY